MSAQTKAAFAEIHSAIKDRPAVPPMTPDEKKLEAVCLAGLTIAESIVDSLSRIASALEKGLLQ